MSADLPHSLSNKSLCMLVHPCPIHSTWVELTKVVDDWTWEISSRRTFSVAQPESNRRRQLTFWPEISWWLTSWRNAQGSFKMLTTLLVPTRVLSAWVDSSSGALIRLTGSQVAWDNNITWNVCARKKICHIYNNITLIVRCDMPERINKETCGRVPELYIT